MSDVCGTDELFIRDRLHARYIILDNIIIICVLEISNIISQGYDMEITVLAAPIQ